MPQLEYSFIVELTLNSGSTYDTSGILGSFSSRTLLDGADGDDNGIVADGDAITLFLDPVTINATLLGIDAEGVAVQDTGGSGTIYYLSNSAIGAQVTLSDAILNFATAPGTPTEQNFSNLHEVQENSPGNYEIVADGSLASLSPSPRIIDDQDGTPDGVVSDGSTITAEAGVLVPNGTYTIVDITANGEIIVNSGGTLYMFSDLSYEAGNTFVASSASSMLCFAAGTLIETPDGETPVETLGIGDLLRAEDGRDVAVKWVGQQSVSKLFAGSRAQLVRIRAGALGNHSDLYVTGDHGMVIDGYVINALALVNGGSIDWVSLADTPDRQTVYHIETEAHDVILANGAASETYLDVPGRMAFDNFAEYLDLYGAEHAIQENPMPRISSRRLLPASVRAKLGMYQAS